MNQVTVWFARMFFLQPTSQQLKNDKTMGEIPVAQVIGVGDWSTGLLDCCGGDGFGKAGDSAGATVCE
jgi:hypothetical protein